MDYQYTGVIIGKRDVGEADRIYSIYTKENGKIQTLAKGVRRSQAKLAGALEPLTLVDIAMVRSYGLGKITGAIVENNFSRIKQDFRLLKLALEDGLFLDRLTDFESVESRLFDLLREYLEVLDNLTDEEIDSKGKIVSLGLRFRILGILGYSLEIYRCVACGGQLLSGQKYGWGAEIGGITCQECSSLRLHRGNISINGIKLLRLFAENSLPSLRKIAVSEKDTKELDRIIGEFSAWVGV